MTAVSDGEPARNEPVDAGPRPASLDPAEIGFRPRRPVPWLGPVLLAATGARVAMAEQFGAYLDKRELQNAFPKQIHDHSGKDELWLDFVADLGDGFDATYSVAHTLAQPELELDGVRLPRADVLVMGGDQVYPTASNKAYEDRFRGPYRAAMPTPPPGDPAPTLYALPGNHDWYDGLTAFLRVFARREGTRIGGWRTAQTRSYFALKLPQRWWLFAIDVQPGSYLDDPQLAYFDEVAAQVQPGDRVIVCTPNPFWVEAADSPSDYDTTDYFLRKVVAPTGATVALMLSGDLHHYARYANENRELITAGGGGAFLYATHELPEQIMVPPRESIVRGASRREEFSLKKVYPSASRSQRLGTGVFTRLPLRNPGFLALLGILQTMLLLALDSAKGRIVTTPIFLMVVAMFGLTLFFSAGLSSQRRARHYLLGVGHGLVQVGLGVCGLLVWRMLPFDQWVWPLPALTAAVCYGPVVAVVSGQVVALYLLIASRFGVNLNELFAGQGIEDYKNFLRLHVDRDGSLTIYAVGLDRAGKRWHAAPTAAAHAPWFEPAEPLPLRLIEPPIVVTGRTGA